MSTPNVVGKIGNAKRQWRQVRQVLDQSLVTFLKDDALTVSGSIAYFSMLSIFPLLLLLVSLSGLYIRHFELSGELTVVLESFLPMKPDFILKELVGISQAFGRISLLSFLLLVWSSSGMFLPLEKALNRAWEVEKSRSWWRSYLVAFEMAFIFAVFILAYASLASVNVYLQKSLYVWAELHPAPALVELFYQTSFALVTFGMTLLIFTILFQRLPNRHLGSRKVLPGAILTAIFWEAARTLFTRLLPLFNYSHVYGSIGVVVALMTWLYISSVVTLFGAHVSRSLYRTLHPADLVVAPAATLPVESTIQSVGEAR